MDDQTRTCLYCGAVLSPKRYVNGKREDRKQFENRQFCGDQCSKSFYAQKANSYRFSDDGLTGYGTLSTGEVFLFDAEDYDRIKNTSWYSSNSDGRYVSGSAGVGIHRIIMNAPDGCVVDHINRDPLDNRKCNLRFATRQQSRCNRDLQANNVSGVSGVTYKKNRDTWNARIKYYGDEIHLGAYKTYIEAVQARNEGMRWIYGEFGIYTQAPEAPPWIKEYVKNKCARCLGETAVYYIPRDDVEK